MPVQRKYKPAPCVNSQGTTNEHVQVPQLDHQHPRLQRFYTTKATDFSDKFLVSRDDTENKNKRIYEVTACLMYSCDDICDRIWENPPYEIFLKIAFDVQLISPTIELTHIQVPDRSRVTLRSYSALFAIAPHPQ